MQRQEIAIQQNHIEFRKLERSRKQMESNMLEVIDGASKALDSGDKMRKLASKQYRLLDEKEAKFKAELSNPFTRQQARINLRQVAKLRRTTTDAVRKVNRNSKKGMDRVKHAMQGYLASIEDVDAQMALAERAELINDRQEVGVGYGGQSVLGQLGMALFAWKSSNAFDNLNKIARSK